MAALRSNYPKLYGPKAMKVKKKKKKGKTKKKK